jgi:hypothetical protein
MISRLEIRLKSNLTDAEGAGVKRKSKDYFGMKSTSVSSASSRSMQATSERVERRDQDFYNP